MKTEQLGDYLLWHGKPAKIIGETSNRVIIFEMLQESKCPHCNGQIGKEQIHMIPESPIFKENAQPLPTIKII